MLGRLPWEPVADVAASPSHHRPPSTSSGEIDVGTFGRLTTRATIFSPPGAHAAPEDELCSATSLCPLCNGSSRLVFTIHGYPVVDCTVCNHRFVPAVDPSRHLEDIYGDDYFVGSGAGYDDYFAEGEMLIRHGRRYAKILARHAQPGTVLWATCHFDPLGQDVPSETIPGVHRR